MNNIIGLVGFAGSGKDTVGNILVNDYGYKKYSMAKPLKDVVSILFSWDRTLIDGSTEESRLWREQPDEWWNKKLNWEERFGTKFTPRICLQHIGTDILRNYFDNNIWLLCMEKYLNNHMNEKIVITDCRFKNEISAIKNIGGKIIRIKRGDDPTWYSTIENMKDNNISISEMAIELKIHESEIDWIGTNFDNIIKNDHNLEILKEIIRNIEVG